MKISVHTIGNHNMRKVMEADISGQVVLSKVFNAVTILTEDGKRFGIAQRDSGLEIVCPDGTLVGVKLYEGTEISVGGSPPKKNQTFIERNGEVVG